MFFEILEVLVHLKADIIGKSLFFEGPAAIVEEVFAVSCIDSVGEFLRFCGRITKRYVSSSVKATSGLWHVPQFRVPSPEPYVKNNFSG
jgi:hypothetical protein